MTIDRTVPPHEWMNRLREDITRDAQKQPVPERCTRPNCYGLTVTNSTGEMIGGPHWHVIDDGRDLGANPWPPPRARQIEYELPQPTEALEPCANPECYGFTVTGVDGEALGGPHSHVFIDGRDAGANPWPPPPPPPPPRVDRFTRTRAVDHPTPNGVVEYGRSRKRLLTAPDVIPDAVVRRTRSLEWCVGGRVLPHLQPDESRWARLRLLLVTDDEENAEL